MNEALHGVNLGGWLLLEKWMTPSLFAGTNAEDEFSFMQTPDALKKITKHRNDFITEADFAWLAEHNVSIVRIPVGYWLLQSEPPYAAGASYLDWAFKMARKYNIKVLLDIHALPGSQNGNDHSGRIGPALWQKDATMRIRSLHYVRSFAERYALNSALWGIEIINEPNAGVLQFALRSYYRRAYNVLAKILPAHVHIIYSDAWSPRLLAFALLFRRRAVMDIHLYHMATLGTSTHSVEWYYRKLRRRVRTLALVNRFRPIIIGEWSGVLRGESLQGLSPGDAARAEQTHLELQKTLYSSFTATFYWNYKLEATRGVNYWDYRSLVENNKI